MKFCSFCGKDEHECAALIQGGGPQPPRNLPVIYICDECVALCASMLRPKKPDLQEVRDPILVAWTRFILDERELEWMAARVRHGKRFAIMITVRKPGMETGPGMLLDEPCVPSEAHAIEAARMFQQQLDD